MIPGCRIFIIILSSTSTEPKQSSYNSYLSYHSNLSYLR